MTVLVKARFSAQRGTLRFALAVLVLLLSSGFAGAGEAAGRYEGVLGGAPYLINATGVEWRPRPVRAWLPG